MKDIIKKRLMFVTAEDFYLIAYSIIVILDCLDCKKNRKFKDYRKLPFIIEIINNNMHLNILELSENRTLHKADKEYLFQSYVNGLSKRSEILKILFTLEKRGYVSLYQSNSESAIDTILNKEALPENFLSKGVFGGEYLNCTRFKKVIQRCTSISLNTFLEKTYQNRGMKTWDI